MHPSAAGGAVCSPHLLFPLAKRDWPPSTVCHGTLQEKYVKKFYKDAMAKQKQHATVQAAQAEKAAKDQQIKCKKYKSEKEVWLVMSIC